MPPGAPHSSIQNWGGNQQHPEVPGTWGGNGAALLSPTGLGDVMGAHTAPWSSGSPPSLNSGKNSPSCAPDVLQAAPGHHLHPITHSPTTPPSNNHLTAPQPWHPVWEKRPRGHVLCWDRRTDTQTAPLCHRREWGQEGGGRVTRDGHRGDAEAEGSRGAPVLHPQQHSVVTHRTPLTAVPRFPCSSRSSTACRHSSTVTAAAATG